MSGFPKRAPAALALAWLAACTPMRYERAGAGDAERAADARECRDLAYAEALRTPFYWSPASPLWPWGPAHDLRFSRFAYFEDPSYWRWQHERDLADFCMRSRGWRLVPVAEPPG